MSNDKCTKWWHILFHFWLGTEQSVSTCLKHGSKPETDYHFSKYSCWVCKKKWIVDYTKEDREWEKMRDEVVNV